ncbi:hypothetical protein [Gordonia rhizosphera]|uniref:Low molecular weight antigen MTB12-like C-terminal domain-containing protein n=1 Tax=Gordonia rhizosphera NBRC 16068 TaxID=1108045 RepID=K6W7J4_9ACTN|nr:hypothetical protein [Gordonia rhizosphera]GAB89691.1 hypothetical protein GORHZ_069_00700 [Gordonia rhizosphera NBRC 16068]
MRRTVIGRALAMCAGAIMVVGVAAGCSSDSDSDSSASSAAAASSASATADAATTQEITDNFVTFFNGQTPPAERAALITDGAAFEPVLQGLTQNPQSMQTTAAVKSVTMTDVGHADVTFDLLLQGTPVLPDQLGQSVNEDGTWKVSAATFCALLSVQGGVNDVPACA